MEKLPVVTVMMAVRNAAQCSPSNYRDLSRRLSSSVLVLGSTREAGLLENIADGLSGRAIGACGLSIDKVAALIAKSGLLLGNDSALAHLASAQREF
jgi:ADP-heptose:LPS heptosyltransferase